MKLNLTHPLLQAFALAFSLATLPAQAADHPAQAGAGESSRSSIASDAFTDGEIRKVDKDSGKITIRHGELKNLAMPPMTMVFRAKDPAMLDQVKAGDKVMFIADKVEGLFTVMKIKIAQ
jgi:Cu(I)/Ag(I) efflux system protein CusF